MKTKLQILKEIIPLGIALFVFTVSLNENPEIRSLAFNADTLYPMVLQQDLMEDGNSLRGWSLTPSPYFFPDVAIAFLIRTFVRDGIASVYLAFLGQALFLLFALLFAFETENKSQTEQTKTRRIIVLAYSSFLILVSVNAFFFPILGFASHGNALSFTFICFGLWRKNLRLSETPFLREGWKLVLKRTFIGALQILLIASDPLFVFYFSIPCILLAAWEWKTERNRETVARLLFLILSTGIGWFAYRALTKSDFVFIPTGYYTGTTSWNVWEPITTTISHQLKTNPISFYFWIGILPSLFLWRMVQKRTVASPSPVDPTKNTVDSQTNSLLNELPLHSANRILAFLILSAIVSTIGIFISGNLSGIFQKDGVPLRYFLPLLFVWFPIPIAFLSELPLNYNKGIFIFLYTLLFGLVFFASARTSSVRKPYQDSLVDCLDANQERFSLNRGISDFWTSRRIRIFSKKEIRADNYLGDLHPEYWQNSWSWYLRIPAQEYNFAVLPGLDEAILKKEFGAPQSVIACENHEILIWNKDSKDRFARFREKKREEIELWHKLTGRKPISPETR
ncbi:hypothetical protein EHQ05_11165 [Leptospira yasudae]|uniref:hypothetical protein n=1 Tax=Leptospira yasudae TaxID=2202201 RepID=UPI0010834251|nr:hypothetical protein [Leptospira yasudae]TGK26312.1 hypothetical protein EHQ05_11165 [Leptospira yasudae]TGM08443.1 hypothetical protein EHQ86_02390 [Leptospira yasudae]